MRCLRFLFALCLLPLVALAQDQPAWPPPLPGAVNGTATVTSPRFLEVPEGIETITAKEGAAGFVMAKTPPTVELAFHGNLPGPALNGTGWTSWGDICLADDGRVYSGIGDHGHDWEGTAHAYIYRWDPKTHVLEQIVDVNAIVPRQPGEPTWSKVHARICQGADGGIYFTATLNDGNRAGQEKYHWSERLPGGQIYRIDPATAKAEVFANLPPARCTATDLLDAAHNRWWCYLEAGKDGVALFGLDMTTRKPFFQSADGTVGHYRNFALTPDGAIYYNGPKGELWKYDPATNSIAATKTRFQTEKDAMRCSTRLSKDGHIYGVTMANHQLFRYTPATDTLEYLGHDFLLGNYVTVIELSPDEKYLYYLPGAHGKAVKIGTTVMQYEIATGQRKVLAFLGKGLEEATGYVPGGTYGVKISHDGSVLYVNFNGHATDANRLPGMRPNGFGFTAFAAIHIPASERQ